MLANYRAFKNATQRIVFAIGKKNPGPRKLLIKMSDVRSDVRILDKISLLSILHHFNVFLKLIDKAPISIQK